MRTSRGLPFNACVHARVCATLFGKPAHLITNHDSTRGWLHLGLLTLPTAGEREQVRGAREERYYALVCMSNHPDLTANQSLYRVLSLFALLQGSFTETRDEQCVFGIRDEHTCSLYLIHRSLFVHFQILEFLKLLLVWSESVCLFINVCLVIFKTT